MKVFNNYKDFPTSTLPLALSIGIFDGVHLGHQALLSRLKQMAPQTAVFTFSNYPDEVLHGVSILQLTTLSHRLALFEKMGIDHTILVPFTQSFSQQTARQFLTQINRSIPFSYLVLGHDAVIGHDRNCDLSDLTKELSFVLEYLEPIRLNGKVISSSEIRKCILAGKLAEASALLGRPYSIFANVVHGQGKGGILGFHTANLPVEELALPPLGVYIVKVKIDHTILPAVANLGYAPTLHKERPLCLEVHLIDDCRDLYDKELEVFFLKYLRPEIKFEHIDALKNQIRTDIHLSKEHLGIP